ncbi:putative transposase, partial [Cedecea sp. NFIX57]
VGMVRASRCHRLNMKTYIINGSEVSRLSVAIQMRLNRYSYH